MTRLLYGLLVLAVGLIITLGSTNLGTVPTIHPQVISPQTMSAEGSIAFASNRDGGLAIYIMNADGRNVNRLTDTNGNDEPAWSSDGKYIAFTSTRDGHLQIYLMNADGSNQTNLSQNSANEAEPAWSPDNKRIVFSSSKGNELPQIYIMKSDGSSRIKVINGDHPRDSSSPSWSPDGKRIAFSSSHDGPSTFYLVDVNGTNLTMLGHDGFHSSWSPDGKHIASNGFLSNNRQTIYLTDLMSDKAIDLLGGILDGAWPTWSPDGKSIAFNSNLDTGNGSQIYKVNVDGTVLVNISNSKAYDVHPAWKPSATLHDIQTSDVTLIPTATASRAIPESTYSSIKTTLLALTTNVAGTVTQQMLMPKTLPTSTYNAQATRTAEAGKSKP